MKIKTGISLSEPQPHFGQLISNYQDGLTSQGEAETVERHLLECERCREFYAGLQQARESIGDLPAWNSDSAQLEAYYWDILTKVRSHPRFRKPKRPGGR